MSKQNPTAYFLLFWFKYELLENSICCGTSDPKPCKNYKTVRSPFCKCHRFLRDIVCRSIKGILNSWYVLFGLQEQCQIGQKKFEETDTTIKLRRKNIRDCIYKEQCSMQKMIVNLKFNFLFINSWAGKNSKPKHIPQLVIDLRTNSYTTIVLIKKLRGKM